MGFLKNDFFEGIEEVKRTTTKSKVVGLGDNTEPPTDIGKTDLTVLEHKIETLWTAIPTRKV